MGWSNQSDKRAYEIEWSRHHHGEVHGAFAPAQDPTNTANAMRRRLGGRTGQILFGHIVDGVAYAQAYKVFLEQNHPPIVCTLAGPTSFLPFGPKQINSLSPGTDVLVWVHPDGTRGMILAALPGIATDPTLALSDVIHQANRSGLRVDSVHHAVMRLSDNGSVVDWSAGRPFDGTLGGEWGAITATGLRVTLDDFMAQLSADEACGVTAFYDDLLLRLAGINLQVRTAGSEEETLLDEGEILVYRGETPYPWEAAGVLVPGIDPFRDVDAQTTQVDEPHYTAIEPVNDDQMPFHRVVTLGGYVGQGGHKLILVPDASGDPYYRYGGTAPAAVFEESLSLTGRKITRSAKGIFSIKQPAIPGVKRLVRPESPTGDGESDYKFAGLTGSGEDHKVAGEVKVGTDLPGLQQAAGILDTIAYACNWDGVAALHYHAKDWALPEESATTAKTNQTTVGYAALADTATIDPPEPFELTVDHRYGAVKYYPNTSVISQLEDGGIVIRAGCGESITMAGGEITLSAPSNIWIKSGKNVIGWAGYDVILRAKHSADVSATEGDARLKAEGNVQVLAGNGGIGALLLESRGVDGFGYEGNTGEDVVAGGIHLKAAQASVAAWAQDIYLRTGGGDVGAGQITLDAARGQQPITTYSDTFLRYLGTSAADYFGTEGNVTGANQSGPDGNTMSSGLTVGGYSQITGGLAVQGDVTVDQGHISTQLADQYSGLVGSVGSKALADLEDQFQQGTSDHTAASQDGQSTWKTQFENYWYGKDQAGADATITAAGFSFRSVKQYRTDKFRIFEDPWQQAARLGSDGVPAFWTEKAVAAGSTPTYPYPGYEKWTQEQTLLEQDLTLYDVETGVAQPRDPALYGAPELATPKPQVPDGRYAVIL